MAKAPKSPESEALLRVRASVEHLEKWNTGHPRPEIAVVLGSGLADAVPGLDALRGISFSEIPGFRATAVAGHRSELRVGRLSVALPDGTEASREVAFLRGRNHAYEGFSPAEVVHNLRALVSWGCQGVVLTNAAGCLEGDWNVGSLMAIADHINHTGKNPLAHPDGLGFSPTFVDMSQCYDPTWRAHLKSCAASLGIELHEGTYFGVLGPSYETPAEIRMMKTLGAHAVGMSTVLEAIASRQLGARVAGLSCLTNHGAGLRPETILDHADVLHVGRTAAASMARLLTTAVCTLPLSPAKETG